MAKTEAPPEDRWVLGWRGQDLIPNIPPEIETPCRNTDWSGRRLPNGGVMDLWAGEGYGRTGKKKAYREAATLCEQVCLREYPEAFGECAKYQARFQPKDMVYAGVIPPDGIDPSLN